MIRMGSWAGGALLFLATVAVAQAPGGDPAKGQAVFEDRCTLCHQLRGGGQGPDLAGVVGRKAGAMPGFPYSTAMAGSGLTWTAANLDLFLAGTTRLVPGAAMSLSLSDPAQRRDLIAYLATQK